MVFFEPLFFWKPPPPSSDFDESEKEDKMTKKKEEEEKKRSQIFGVAQKFEKSQKKLEEKLSQKQFASPMILRCGRGRRPKVGIYK